MRLTRPTTLALAGLALTVGAVAAPTALAAPSAAPTAMGAAASATGADARTAAPLDSCDALLVDSAGVLSAEEARRVTEAARSFRSETAFEVRIRILTQQEAPSLESWMDAQEAACPTWLTADGGFRSNLVVLAFTTDSPTDTGETGLYYGAQMPSDMDQAWPRILADEINPAIRDGDWDRGITSGLTAVERAINPPSRSGQFAVVVAALVVVLVGLVGGGVAVGRRRRRRQLAERFAAATAKLDELTLPLDDQLQLLRRDTELLREAVADEEETRGVAPAERLLREGDRILHQRSELSIGRDRVLEDRDLAAVERAVSAWEELASSAATLMEKLTAEQRRLADLVGRLQTVRERARDVPRLAEKVAAAADAGERDGFVVTTERSVLDTVGERLAEIDRLAAERRLLSADERLTALVDDLTSAHKQLTRLRRRRAALTTLVGKLQEATAKVSDLAEEAAAALAELQTGYAPSLWTDAATFVSAGRERLASARERASAAESALAAGDLGTGERHAEAWRMDVRHARRVFTRVIKRLGRVRQLRDAVPRKHADVAARLDRLQTIVSTPDVNGSLRAKAATLTSELKALDIHAEQPDWITLNRQLTALRSRVDAAVREATRARAEAERRHREAYLRTRPRRTTGFSFSGGTSRFSGGTSRGARLRSSTGRHGGSVSRSSRGRRGGSARR